MSTQGYAGIDFSCVSLSRPRSNCMQRRPMNTYHMQLLEGERETLHLQEEFSSHRGDLGLIRCLTPMRVNAIIYS